MTLLEYNVPMENLYSYCNLCPRHCGVDRTSGDTGFCKSPSYPVVNLYKLHFGEEPVISGINAARGSGTVFFEGCGTGCVFCQNYDISHRLTGRGTKMDAHMLSDVFLELQSQGAYNINLVTPMHYAPTVADSIASAKLSGLKIPVAINCSGYDSVDTLRLFDGLADIYMPDMKFFSAGIAGRFAGAPDYFQTCCLAIDEMYRQVGSYTLSPDGLLMRGMIVRHLMLPGCLFDTKHILEYLCARYGNNIAISLMSQYTPMPHITSDHNSDPRLRRHLSAEHYNSMCTLLSSLGQTNAFVQELGSSGDSMIPDFKT